MGSQYPPPSDLVMVMFPPTASSLMTLGLNTLDLVRPHGLPPDHNFPCMGNTRDPR